MDRSLVLDGERRNYQLHLKLGDMDLQDFVREVAAAASRSLEKAGREADPLVVALLRNSIRESLRKVVVARDVCGLAEICRSADEYDPWVD